ncbi:MAG TPA: type II CAAX endopeptidase family protein [Phycisphaerae bacterium]|nr:type II CAAX endopeptidase family protein [Phycisphaerae bacterium]HOJ72845.1 type II CAAX endopeptidase family protein [Phycisphaerae bacterium]HOM51728.1 type II CAAX endopeptidase family protein [Phycisphaerae bacterium]HON67618.1 type II CAAX endopeptidase family protein [Phycisphaerae bacterium]HOQ86948.1 type II CAAX endopeptidase family protein [Phycisphaerae bacterium]
MNPDDNSIVDRESAGPPPDPMIEVSNPAHSLPDVPVARPVLVDSLPAHVTVGGTYDVSGSLASSLVRLTPWRAVWQLVCLLLAGLAGVVIGLLLMAGVQLRDERWANMFITAFAGMTCILAAFALVGAARQRPSAIGWRVNNILADVGLGVAGAFGMYMVMMMAAMVLVLIRPDLMDQAQKGIEKTIPRASIPMMVAFMAFVALWEEVVFRGFLLTRLFAVFRRWWLAVLVGSVLFSLGHAYQGVVATVVIGCVGIVLGVMFVWRRSLLPVIVFHMMFNLIGLLILRSQSETWK